ncbi:MAG: lipopolysaccharide kinase InaA family protein [Phycisphaerae bacterium]
MSLHVGAFTLNGSTQPNSTLRQRIPGEGTSGESSRATDVTSESVCRVRQGAATWLVVTSRHDELLGPGAPDWFSLETDQTAHRVKSGRHRATWQVSTTSSGSTIYAKVYERDHVAAGLGRLFRRDSAWREWRAARAAMQKGIPAARPLGVGTQYAPRRLSVYLSQGVAGCVSLAEAWNAAGVHEAMGSGAHSEQGGTLSSTDPCPQSRGESAMHLVPARPQGDRPFFPPTRRQIGNAVAHLLATSHERGFFHSDNHPENLLVRTTADDRAEAVFVDLYSARAVMSAVSSRRAMCALAQLNQYFRRTATRTQRLRFLRAYLAGRPSLGYGDETGQAARAWARAVVRLSNRHAAQLARHRDRRLRRNDKYFATVKLGDGWAATAVLRLERRHVFPETGISDRSREEWVAVMAPLSSVAACLGDAKPAHQPVRGAEHDGGAVHPKAARGALTASTYRTGELDGGRLCYELIRIESLASRIAATLFGSSHRRTFERCHALRHRDVQAELILAYVEHRSSGLIDCTVLVRPRPSAGGEETSRHIRCAGNAGAAPDSVRTDASDGQHDSPASGDTAATWG